MYDYTITNSSLLEKDECKKIIEYGLSLGLSQGQNLAPDDTPYVDLNIRRCKSRWILDKLPFEEIDEKIKSWSLNFADKIVQGNHNNKWIYSLAEYKENDFHAWHIDDYENRTTGFRKFVTIIQLSDPSDYEGGDLEIGTFKVDKTIGSSVSFVTTRRHRVTTIVKGTRYSLVAWLIGPPWR